jgi:hypothetical protein
MIRALAWAMGLLAAAHSAAAMQDPPSKPKGFGKTWVLKVEAKTRGFPQATFLKNLHPHEESLRVTGRNPAEAGKTSWEQWTFQAAEGWKLDLGVFPTLFGKSYQIRRYEIAIEGEVKPDDKKTLWLTHLGSGTKLRLTNRPKRKGEDGEPPDIRSSIEADLKEGPKRFRVTGDVVDSDGLTVLMAMADVIQPRRAEDE